MLSLFLTALLPLSDCTPTPNSTGAPAILTHKAAERAGVERLLTGPRPLFALLPGRGA